VFCKLNPFLWTCWSWCRVMPSEHRVPEISIWDKMRQYWEHVGERIGNLGM
jgi:hypothetical protein